MKKSSAAPADAAEWAVRTYGDVLFRVCLVMLCNEHDAEDALQDTFVRYLRKAPAFRDAEHEKAWLLKVASNVCRDMLRFRLRHAAADIDALEDCCRTEEDSAVLESLCSLPPGNRIAVQLHYVEGYRVEEISGILGISADAVKKRLQRGRELLKLEYGKENSV